MYYYYIWNKTFSLKSPGSIQIQTRRETKCLGVTLYMWLGYSHGEFYLNLKLQFENPTTDV